MRLLLITSRYPRPAWRGNQVRTMEWIEALVGHELTMICPELAGSAPVKPPVDLMPYKLGTAARASGLARAALGGRPFQEGLYAAAAGRRAVAEALRMRRPDVVIVQMIRCGWAYETIRTVASTVPVVFDAIDAMGLHFERAAVGGSVFAPVYAIEARRCRRRETELSAASALTVAVSERDLSALAVPPGRGRVVPVTGREVARSDGPAGEPVVLLSGNLGYRPTVEGAVWFAREVWPRVRRRVADARWILAGARPTAAIRRLSKIDGVEVHGDVPDLGAFLRSARVAVAPMSSGSGVPMKVLEAIAAGVPVVVHPWAAAGLASGSSDAVASAEGADEWIATLTELLGDVKAASDLGRRGHELWRKYYHPERVAEQIREVVSEAAEIRREVPHR
jgi:glycosyltransferase involved in cell wall biosynthesis